MHSALKFFKPKVGDEEQSGINMVDLMMWLVIAALLLAAAIQGIGYYQQNANVYQMKSAVDVAKSRVMAVAANDGSLDIEDVDTVVAEENANHPNDNVTLSVDTIELTATGESGGSGFELASFATATTVAPGETYYIRATHEGVAKYDVIHLFKDTASKKEGTHLVDKGATGPATPGGGTPEPTETASPAPTATPSPSTTATPTPSATPTPTPTPTATRPADSSAAGTIVAGSGYSSWWADKTAQSMASDAGATFGFTMTGGASPLSTANYDVVFTGSSEIAVKTTQSTQFTTNGGGVWYATIRPEAGGFKEGVGYVTATVTNKTTGAVSKKSWQLTVTAQVGMTQYTRSPDWWNGKTASAGASDETATFGFQITDAAASDYTVTFTGGENIGAAATQHVSYANSYGAVWFSSIRPVAGGFTVGTGTITATATHNNTGKSFTRNYQLTIGEHVGMTQYTRSPDWWNGKTASAGVSGEVATFGFQITNAAASDYDVTFTGGQNIGAAATQHVSYANSYGAVWFSSIKPVAGGFTVGTGTITATATHKLTGKVYTRTYQLTIAEHVGMTQYARSPSWWLDKTVTAGSTTGQTFGFQFTGAAVSDYTVTITGGSGVNGTPTSPSYANSYGAVWFATVNPGTGGFTVGTSTITATATHNLTGKVYTKTYTLTVN